MDLNEYLRRASEAMSPGQREADIEHEEMVAGWRGQRGLLPGTAGDRPFYGTGYGGMPSELGWYEQEEMRYLPEAFRARMRAARPIFGPRELGAGEYPPRIEPWLYPRGTDLPEGETWLTRTKAGGLPAGRPGETWPGGGRAFPARTLGAVWPEAEGGIILGVEPARAIKRAQLAMQEAAVPWGRELYTAPVSMSGFPPEVGARYRATVALGGVMPEGMGWGRPGYERFGPPEVQGRLAGHVWRTAGFKAYIAPSERVPAGSELLLPRPKDPIQWARAMISYTPSERLAQMGFPMREGRVRWTPATHQQIMETAWEKLVRPGLSQQTFRVPFRESLLEALPGGTPTRQIGPGLYEAGISTLAWTGGLFAQPTLAGAYVGRRPLVNPEEMAELYAKSPEFAERLRRWSAPWRQRYEQPVSSALGTLTGVEPTAGQWQQVMGLAREFAPEGRIPPHEFVRAMGRVFGYEPITTRAAGGGQVTLPSPRAMMGLMGEARLLPMEEGREQWVYSQMFGRYGRTFMAQQGLIGGTQSQQRYEQSLERYLQHQAEFAGATRVRRMLGSAAPRYAWEGPVWGSTALPPHWIAMGKEALQRTFGVRGEEQMQQLQQALQEQVAVGRVWRRPTSDVSALGLRGRIVTEEMAQERGLELAQLGGGVAVSPWILFTGIGDFDTDRLAIFMETPVSYNKERGYQFRGGERMMLEQRDIPQMYMEMMRTHAPDILEKFDITKPEQLLGEMTREWNEAMRGGWSEASAWGKKMRQPTTIAEAKEWFMGGPEGYRETPLPELLTHVRSALVATQGMQLTYQQMRRTLQPYMVPEREKAWRAWSTGMFQPTVDIRKLSPQARELLQYYTSLSARTGWMTYTQAPWIQGEEGLKQRQVALGKYPGVLGPMARTIAQVPEVPVYARAEALAPTEEQIPQFEQWIRGKQWGQIAGAVSPQSPMLRSILAAMYGRQTEGEKKVQGGRVFWQMSPEEREFHALGQRQETMLRMMGKRKMGLWETMQYFRGGLATRGWSRLRQRVTQALGLPSVPAPTPELAQTLGEIGAEMGAAPPMAPEVVGAAAEMYPQVPAPELPAEVAQAGVAAVPTTGRPTPRDRLRAYHARMRQQPAAVGGAVPPRRPAAPAGGGAGGGDQPPTDWWQGLMGMFPQGFRAGMEPTEAGGHRGYFYAQGTRFTQQDIQSLRYASQNLQQYGDVVRSLIASGTDMDKQQIAHAKVLARWTETVQSGQRQMEAIVAQGGQVPPEVARAVAGAGGIAGGMGWLAPWLQNIQDIQAMGAGGGGGGGGFWGAGGARGALQRGLGAITRWYPMMAIRRAYAMTMAPVFAGAQQYAAGQIGLQQAQMALGAPPVFAGVAQQALERQRRMALVQQAMGRGAYEVTAPLLGALAQPGVAETLAVPAAIGGLALGGGLIAGLGAQYLGLGVSTLAATGVGMAAVGVPLALSYLLSEPAGGGPPPAERARAWIAQQASGGLASLFQWGGREDLAARMRANQARQAFIAQGAPPTTTAQFEQFLRGLEMPLFPRPEQRRAMAAQWGALGVTQAQLQRQPWMMEWAAQQYAGGRDVLGLTGQAMGAFGLPVAGQIPAWLRGMDVQQLRALPQQLQVAAPTLGMLRQMAPIPLAQQQALVGVAEPEQYQFRQVLQGDPLALSWWMGQQGLQGMADLLSPLRYQQRVTGLQAQQLGLSRAQRDWSAAFQGVQIQAQREYLAGVYPLRDQLRGIQWEQTQAGFAYQGAMADVGYRQSLAGLAYQEAQAGLGYRQAQAGWAYQEQMAGLGYRQQMAAFDQGAAQRALQARQFEENWQLSRRGLALQTGYQRERAAFGWETQMMQRGWQREDWELGEATARMQWGWRQADISRALRRARGPERADLLRQREREQTLENLRRQQFEENKDRQEELWSRADEQHARDVEYADKNTALQLRRLEQQKEHFEETSKLQESYASQVRGFFEERTRLSDEYREKQKEFYEEGKSLSDEYRATQRSFLEERKKLSDEYRGAVIGFYEESFKIQEEIEEKARTWQEDQLVFQEDRIAMTESYTETADKLQDTLIEIQTRRDEFILGWKEQMFTDPDSVQHLTEKFLEWWRGQLGDVGGGEVVEPTAEEKCIASGGVWKNGACQYNPFLQSTRLGTQPLSSIASATETNKLLEQLLAATLQLGNMLGVNVFVDSDQVAAKVLPKVGNQLWDQTYLQ